MKPVRFAFLLNTWDDNLGPMYISSFLKAAGHASDIFIEERGWLERVAAWQPDVLAFSVITGHQQWTIQVAARLRAIMGQQGRRPLVLVGGPHPTYYPEMILDPQVDVLCQGDGEEAALELAHAIGTGNWRTDIPNLSFKADGRIITNEMRSLGRDNDRFAFPDREYYARYPLMRDNPYRNVITGRGCPYKCNFCFNPTLMDMYKGKDPYIRRRSVDDVIRELVDIEARWGLQGVRFVDDLFTLNKTWLREFLPEYKKYVGKPFTCNVRADVLGEEMAAKLKEAGCRMVLFGIESGSQRIRNEILKKTLSDAEILESAAILKKHKIQITTYNMIGSPGETTEEALMTIDLNRKIKADFPWCSLVQYYPRTDVFNVAKKMGVVEEEFDFNRIGFTYFEAPSTNQPNRDELVNLHRFFLLFVKLPFLQPLLMPLVKKVKPNRLFAWLFVISYGFITLGRSQMGLVRLARIGLKSLWLFKSGHAEPNGATDDNKTTRPLHAVG